MKSATRERVRKAEGDFRTARRESRVTKGPNYDAVCFHGQQCIEKYLKGFLTEQAVRFPKIHDLVKLADFALPRFHELAAAKPLLDLLTRFAVGFRYPGETAVAREAGEAVKAMMTLRLMFRTRLRHR